MNILKSKTIGLTATFALCAALFSAEAHAVDVNDIKRLDQNCAVTQQKTLSPAEANICVQSFYDAAMVEINTFKNQYGVKAKANEQAYCDLNTDAQFMNSQNPEAFLRHPQYCLSSLTHSADKADIAYDKDSAAYLIARLKMLRRLHLEP